MPDRLVAMTLFQVSTSRPWVIPIGSKMPALLNATSSRPSVLTVSSIASLTASASLTSVVRGEGATADLLEGASRDLEPFVVDVDDRDIGAFAGERQCGRATDSACCAGHVGDLAGLGSVLRQCVLLQCGVFRLSV